MQRLNAVSNMKQLKAKHYKLVSQTAMKIMIKRLDAELKKQLANTYRLKGDINKFGLILQRRILMLQTLLFGGNLMKHH